MAPPLLKTGAMKATATTDPIRTSAHRCTAIVLLVVILAPAAWAGTQAAGTMSLSINLVGPGWEQLAAKAAGRTPPTPSPAEQAVVRVVEGSQSSLQQVYEIAEVRRIMDQVERGAVVIEGDHAVAVTDGADAWLDARGGTVHSL